MIYFRTLSSFSLLVMFFLLPAQSLARKVIPFNYASDTSGDADYRFFAANLPADLQSMVIDQPSGLGSSEGSPMKAYIPVYSPGSPDQRQYSILPNSNALVTATGGQLAGHFRFEVRASSNTFDENSRLYMAVREQGEYLLAPHPVTSPSLLSPNQIEQRVDVRFSMDDICEVATRACSDFLGDSSGNRQRDLNLYFFLYDGNLSIEDSISTSTYQEGLYYRLSLSDRVPANSLRIDSLTRGDGRFIIEFSGGENISRMSTGLEYAMLVFDYAPGSSTGGVERRIGEAISQGGRILLLDEEFLNKSGRYTIRPLVNGVTYDVSLALVNKYQFASQLSLSKSGIPEDIQVLLDGQSCFLLTAGFGGSHPIINDFRFFRDTYLKFFSRGEGFVKAYYHIAPHFSSFILRSEFISSYIRIQARALRAILTPFLENVERENDKSHDQEKLSGRT